MSAVSYAQSAAIAPDDSATQILDIEIALGMCNSLLGIINKLLYQADNAVPKDERLIVRLRELQHKFAHTERSHFTRDNMALVREWIAMHGPQLKQYRETGKVPAIISG